MRINKGEIQRTLDVIADTAMILLESGAETYRVEDTAFRMSNSIEGVEKIEVAATYTHIIVSIRFAGIEKVTTRRTRPDSTNLTKIHVTNNFSRKFVNGEYTLSQAEKTIASIGAMKRNRTKRVIGSGIGAAFTDLLIGGSLYAAVLVFFLSAIGMRIQDGLGFRKYPSFVINFVSLMISTIMATIIVRLIAFAGIALDLDNIIVSMIMPFVPGVAIINFVRDTLSGDYISGVCFLFSALIVALSIAMGVGSALLLTNIVGGFLWI
ncbi:MAG: threonine/serine exporter family protein [Finegoldia sp.]|nr:threonine/serine exporter family protein [Finegoldia sp.]